MTGPIVITRPDNDFDDLPDIVRLFQTGMPLLHLRKPGMSRAETVRFLKALPDIYHPKIVLHGHYDLADDYHLKGIHLPERIRESSKEDIEILPGRYRDKGFSVSTSFHSLETL